MRYEIELYETVAGKSPAAKFIDSLPRVRRVKVFATFDRIEEGGDLPVTIFRKMSGTKDLWEIRIKENKDIFRFLSFLHNGRLVVVISGFQKKTEKTPLQEIKIAEARKKEYLKRNH